MSPGGSRVKRYEPRVRLLGRWPFRQRSWQVWDTTGGCWAPNAACGGGLQVAADIAEAMNASDTP